MCSLLTSKETSAIGDEYGVTKKQELHGSNNSYVTEFRKSSSLKDLRNGKHIDHLGSTKHNLPGRLEQHNGEMKPRFLIPTIVNGKFSPSNSVGLVITDGLLLLLPIGSLDIVARSATTETDLSIGDVVSSNLCDHEIVFTSSY